MSSTGRKELRRKDDKYQTDPRLVAAMVHMASQSASVRKATRILDPGCGQGRFSKELLGQFPKAQVVGVDVDPCECEPLRRNRRFEFVRADFPVADMRGDFDLVIGNPPFSLAQAFVQRSLELLAPHGVLMFVLRLGFSGADKRLDWLVSTPLSEVVHCVPRPSFTTGGTDSCEYGVYVWRKQGAISEAGIVYDWVRWKKT